MRPYLMRLSLQIAICCLFTFVLHVNTTSAQSRNLDKGIYQSTQSLDAGQKEMLQQFVQQWTDDLTSEDLAEAVNARDALIEPAENINSTQVFIRAYADALQPVLSNLIASENSLHAENAMRVAAFLRTPRMVALIVDQINPDQVKDQYRRIVAAGLIHVAVAPTTQSGIDSGELTTLARAISMSATKETNWHALLQDLRALSIITNSPMLSEPNRISVRQIQFQTFIDVANKVASSEKPSPLMNAVYRAMIDYRANALKSGLEANDRTREAAQMLRRVLGILGNATVKQWNQLKKDPEAWKAYSGAFQSGAQVLMIMESRPPALAQQLSNAMSESKAAFQTALTNFKNN